MLLAILQSQHGADKYYYIYYMADLPVSELSV